MIQRSDSIGHPTRTAERSPAGSDINPNPPYRRDDPRRIVEQRSQASYEALASGREHVAVFMKYGRSTQQQDENRSDDPHGRDRPDELAEENRVLRRRLRRLEHDDGVAINRFAHCALIAQSSEWTEQLESLGAHRFKRPEALYKTLRSRAFLPEVCIVDLDSIPRNLIKGVDIRTPCPKLWIGGSAANPDDIKTFGAYYSRARPDELNEVIGRLIEVNQAIVLPAGLVGKRMYPFLVADKAHRERLRDHIGVFANANLITLHGDDPLELQLAAQALAVETQRARIWEVKSEASIHPVLRKIAQARRPGSDVTIVLSRDIDVDSARELYKAMPSEYSMINLSARCEKPVDAASFTLPRPADRPADVEAWIAWFVCRSSIDQGIALSGLEGLIAAIQRTLKDNPSIEDMRSQCEHSVRQHATMMEERGEFMSYDDLVRNYERTILHQALTQHDWNLSATARTLGLPESSLRYKLNKLGISKR